MQRSGWTIFIISGFTPSIVFNSSLSNLSNITTSGFGVLGQFSVTTVGQYKVYKTNTLQAGGGGSSITYILT